MRVLLVGFGYVGQALGKQLAEAGHEVTALRRSLIEMPVSPTLRFFQADAGDPSRLRELGSEVDQIVCAVSPDERTALAYKNAYPRVVASLLACFGRARVLLVSSTAVYDQTQGELVDEQAEATANTPLAAEIRAAENLLLDRHTSGPMQADAAEQKHVVVRASGIYGPGRTRLVSSLLHHDLHPEDRNVWTSRVHRDDLAAILRFLVERPHLSGVFNASDPSPTQLKELAAWLRHEVDPNSLPESPPLAHSRKSRRIVPAALTALGYPFLFPSFREGYHTILRAQTTKTDGS